MTNRDPDLRDREAYTRAQVLQFVADQVAGGLPAPSSISFGNGEVSIDLDSIPDRLAWQSAFGMTDTAEQGQPHPIDVPPAQFRTWLTHVSKYWHDRPDWFVSLGADVPITDEHRRQWIESGAAARRAEYVAERDALGEDRG
ncbi:hypothetical protein ACQPZX_41565 [Actinoplanes sp. CA-142083]|uniref:hypothetical protein n=1 Tax=Actinoplanes sp. CA-142083 TaxID=3239903 RepID=UPI003D8A7626